MTRKHARRATMGEPKPAELSFCAWYPDAQDYDFVDAEFGPLPADATDDEFADRYQLAMEHKLDRLGIEIV
jgi:hypothetical protein